MFTKFASALIACIFMLAIFSPNVSAVPLTPVSATNDNPATEASGSIPETHAQPGEGSPYKVLAYGV
ncbi:uncharacterized protein EV420DRAFT_1641549 [Desarmillaria tabescens]|uniref:Uncharacterized protein n=1 Tax=Armillaria tabescens TaxID=1929756 RepID=A0AA39KG78_ARMTA|nr:uncharacterized protein EV420DRAFT_1641549 [Desarmillaria tabescens]KAK0460223.1 hypothetical protein EV420DRAFT_1641549 [Desarmillaria tabescens]